MAVQRQESFSVSSDTIGADHTWTEYLGSWSTNASGEATCTSGNGKALCDSLLDTDDQKVVMDVLVDGKVGAVLRSNGTDFYYVEYQSASSRFQVYRYTSFPGDWVANIPATPPTLPASFRFEIETVGGDPQIRAYINGTLQGSVTDTNAAKLLTGKGAGIHSNAATGPAVVDNWVGQDLSYAGDVVPPTASIDQIHGLGHATDAYDAAGYDEPSDTLTITGTATDNLNSLTQVEVRVGAGGWTVATGTTSWSIDVDLSMLEAGEHTVEARSTDGDGNVSTVASTTFWHCPEGVYLAPAVLGEHLEPAQGVDVG